MAHEVRRAFGAHHHLPAILALPAREIGEHDLVVRGGEIGHARAAARGDQEITVERDGTLLRRPLRDPLELGAIALRRRRLNDEIEPLRPQPAQGSERVVERSPAVAEVVVIAGAQ